MAKKIKDIINIDELARLLGLPSYEQIEELNRSYIDERRAGIEDEDEDARAEAEAQQELYNKWRNAVEFVGDALFGQHLLELTPKKNGYEYKIVPAKDWRDAANKIRMTINGVGFFQFDTVQDFLDSGPYTAREAVLTHLNNIKDYPAVYGSTRPARMFEQAF